ncbi:zinc metallopeptidase [Chondrinema litorale]|uniref:zinc metallopeptidase n=1 Tax=Chondrinema litorale TaxID=2994555 RepID=UPI002543867A|nr:zinc metallopeptidase [Chondrinema litorale]UZR94408.1 zinc metallopeptidase [Chondrinema litorale]
MFWIIFIGFLLLSWIVSSRLKNKFRKYSQIPLQSGLSGAEVARQMLHDNRIYDVEVISVPGKLSDHYNPANKTVNLSEEVYHGRSAASAAIAAHECGHAVQHATAYSFLEFRSAMVPVQSASAKILNFIFLFSFIGGIFFMQFPIQLVLLVIIACYGVISLFSIITLPVELDASKRALAWISDRGVVSSSEYAMSKDALKWAALTYVVAALSSITMLLYYVLQFVGMSDD